MLVLQLFNREKRAYDQFSDINASHMEAYKDAILAYAVYYPVVEVLSSIAVASIIWFGGNGILRHVSAATVDLGFSWKTLFTVHVTQSLMTIGVLVAFMQYAQRFFRPIQDLSEKYNILQGAMAAGERVFKLLDTKVEITSPAVTKKATGAGRIEFDHVWFAYNARGTKPPRQRSASRTSRAETAASGKGVRRRNDHRSSRLGSARRDFRARTGPDHRCRRPYGRGQDYADLAADALLRRAARRDSHRWRRHSRHES